MLYNRASGNESFMVKACAANCVHSEPHLHRGDLFAIVWANITASTGRMRIIEDIP